MMKKLLLILLCLPMIGFGQWSSVGVIPNFSQNQSGHLHNNNFMDFKINNSTNELYLIHPNTNNEIYTYVNSNWSIVGDSGQVITFDENNILYKISLINLYETQNSLPYGGLIQIHKYNNNTNWNIILIDTIYNHADGINTINLSGIFIEDFVVKNNQFYFSISDVISHPFSSRDEFIRVFNYNNILNLLTEYVSPGLLKRRYGTGSSGLQNSLSQSNVITELDFDPNSGDLLICGQQINSNLSIENVVKRFDGNSWQTFGNNINLNNYVGSIVSDYASPIDIETSVNGDLILAFSIFKQSFDIGAPNDLLIDTFIVLKYDTINQTWNEFIGGNPELDLYNINQFSLQLSSDGTPFIAYQNYCNSPSHPLNLPCIYNSSRNVIYYDNTSNTWNQLNTPIISSVQYADYWDNPIIQLNNNNEICVYYTQALTGIVSVKCHQNILSINDVNVNMTNKNIIKIIDLLGRETKGNKNEVLFYIYDDGTVEKRIVIE